MYCPKCGTKLDDCASFCIHCGTKVGMSSSNDVPLVSNYTLNTKANEQSVRSRSTKMNTGKWIAIVTTIMSILVLIVPFITLSLVITSESYSLMGALDLTSIASNSSTWEIIIILAYLAFIACFIIGAFVGSSHGLSAFGTIGSLVLLITCIILVASINEDTYDGFLSFGFGFYLWIVTIILAVVSICTNKKEPIQNYTSELNNFVPKESIDKEKESINKENKSKKPIYTSIKDDPDLDKLIQKIENNKH